ncbi:MAG: histidinol-phosphatase HisJ family protein [Oscillospiraceae bacterium]|nr:histidinol-phosphatase HisJ family protein [Oscillospiraceae bacterium]
MEKRSFYADQHIHTSFSGDSDTPPELQIEKAIELGMERICFTDHHDYDVVSDIDFNLDIPRYFEEMRRLKEKYSGTIKICTGIELGLQAHLGDYLAKTAAEYDFDFIIGSVHFVDGLDPYYPEYFDRNSDNAYEHYFDTVLDCIEKIKCYDSLGHLDYIVRYGAKLGYSYSYGQFAEYIDPILKRVIADGKALECNSGGLSRGLLEPNPCTDILRRYGELGGELVTLGSDAHEPDTLGCCFERCGEILKSCGFKYYAVYENRQPKMYNL